MTGPRDFLAVLKKRQNRIQRMLQPGKRAGSDLWGYSPISDRIGGKRFLESARQMQVLHKDKVRSLSAQPVLTLGSTISKKLSGAAKLLHFSPSARQGSSFWRAMDQVYFNRQAGSREEPAQPSRPGDLRAGSVIQSMSMFPKPGQSLEDFQRQSPGQGVPKPQPPKAAPTPPPVRSKDRLFARVEEITGEDRKTPPQQEAGFAPPVEERQQPELLDAIEPEVVNELAGAELAEESQPEAVDQIADQSQQASPEKTENVQPVKTELKKATPAKKPARTGEDRPLLKAKPKAQKKASQPPTVQRMAEQPQAVSDRAEDLVPPQPESASPDPAPKDLLRAVEPQEPVAKQPLPQKKAQQGKMELPLRQDVSGIESVTEPVRQDAAKQTADLQPEEGAEKTKEISTASLQAAKPVPPQEGQPEIDLIGKRLRSRAQFPLHFSTPVRQGTGTQLVDKGKYDPKYIFPKQKADDPPAERIARLVIQPADAGPSTQKRWGEPLEFALPAAGSSIQDLPAIPAGQPALPGSAAVTAPQTASPPAVQRQIAKPQNVPAQPPAAAPVSVGAASNEVQRIWEEHSELSATASGGAANAAQEGQDAIDLDKLAKEIYPIVKQLLEIEAERTSRNFR